MPELRGYTYLFQEPAEAGAPVFLVLHGTGGDENDMLPFVKNIDSTAGFISVRGNVVDSGQNRYFKRPTGEHFDEEDISENAKKLVQFVNEACEQHKVDRSQLIWIGYSNGANMITSILFMHPAVIQKAILLRPMTILIPQSIPTLPETVLLMASGRQDPLVPIENTQKLIHLLQQTGSIVELFLHDGGHHLEEGDSFVAREWYQKHTGRYVEEEIDTQTPQHHASEDDELDDAFIETEQDNEPDEADATEVGHSQEPLGNEIEEAELEEIVEKEDSPQQALPEDSDKPVQKKPVPIKQDHQEEAEDEPFRIKKLN